jgi:hypothetical protein
MRTRQLFTATVWLCCLGVFSLAAPGAAVEPAGERSDLVFGDPIAFHNMTVVPVKTTREGPFASYTLLEEGLAAKTLAVRELGGNTSEAQVSALEVRNRGKEPVFLLGGEMVLGGKQDRILQSDAVVPPDGKWHQVAVFCVEHGRWAGGDMKFSSGQSLAHAKLRNAAIKGTQSDVWAEVARKNAQHDASSSTGTYRRTVQNADVRKRIASYRAELAKKLPRGRVAGFVFGVNGEVRVADLFGNPVLLDKLQHKLLSAYILEALEHDVRADAAPLTKDKAAGFYKRAKRAKATGKKKGGRSTTHVKQGRGWVGTESFDDNKGELLRESYVAD